MKRHVKANPLDKIFKLLLQQYQEKQASGVVHPEFPDTVKKHFDFGGELLMGHLHYGTSSSYVSAPAIRISAAPRGRRAIWRSRAIST